MKYFNRILFFVIDNPVDTNSKAEKVLSPFNALELFNVQPGPITISDIRQVLQG